jgi:hypothetical protein
MRDRESGASLVCHSPWGSAVGLYKKMSAITILSAFFAIAAAVLWFFSAVVKTPTDFAIHVVRPHQQPMDGNPIEGTYVRQAYSEDLVSLANALEAAK